MIFALRQPAVLLGLVLGFLVGIVLRAGLGRWLARSGSASGRGRLRPVDRGGRVAALRPRRGWAAYLDPYGTVAAVLSGPGWGVRLDARRRGRSSDWQLLVLALVVHGALAAAGFAAYVAAGGQRGSLSLIPVSSVLHGDISLASTGRNVAIGFAMINLACGLLALAPIPPLELGVVLWSRIPRSPGARRLAYRLLEEQWGVAVVLLLLLLPLAGQQPVLLSLIDNLGRRILSLS